jgi:hypothetical protein
VILKINLSLQLRRIHANILIMTAEPQPDATPSRIFKVGLSVPFQDQVSYCVGLGVGPSEDGFREWLHRRMHLSQMPFLWAQVDPVQMYSSGDLERLMHLLAYASGCNPFGQVFWSGEDVSLPDSSERFLQGVAAGETSMPGGSCALLLAGKAISDLRLAAPESPSLSGAADPTARPTDRQIHGTAKEAPLPWIAGFLTLMDAMRRKLAYLWMVW